MSHVDAPSEMDLPERPWGHTHESLTEQVRQYGMESQEQIENEIRNWAASEWILLTRAARRLMEEKSVSESDWPALRERLRKRHEEFWGAYSEA